MNDKVKKLLRFVFILFKRDFKSQYIGSAGGVYWSIVNPLILMVIYTVVFSVVLKIKVGATGTTADFGLFLFCGMLPWFAIQNTLQFSSRVIIENAHLIKQIPLPLTAFPLSITLSSLFYELIALVLFIVLLIAIGNPPGIALFFLPAILIVQIIMMAGLSFLLASLNVFFRDVSQFVSAFIIVWFFATPIVYPPELLPPRLLFLSRINPLTHLVSAYRDVILNNRVFDWRGFLIFGLFAIIIFLFGFTLFQKTKETLADEI